MNRKGIFLGFLLMFMLYAGLVAQSTDYAKPQILTNLLQNNGQSGQIEIVQPEQAENLLKMHITNNYLQKGKIPGYRIQIFSESTQTANQKADETLVNFMKNFPYLDARKEYNSPNWQVFVGNFRTKNEMLREKKKIEKMFPRAFPVSDFIDISK